MRKRLALLALVAGCEANLGTGSNGDTNIDASTSQPADSPRPDAFVEQQQMDAPPPACANGRKVYLNFEGATLTKATASDSLTDKVSWMANASATLPAYHANVAGRANEIATIIGGVRSRLAGLPFEIVTQRPTTGPYVMIVFGGAAATLGTPYNYATNEHDCGDVVKNDVGWVADLPTVDKVPDLVVASVGWGLGLNGTNDPNACMCGWANACVENTAAACTLSASIASTTSTNNTTCPNQNPQNEIAAFSTGFCQ